MADFTWTDVLQDTARFPDAMQVDLGNGQAPVSLADLRGTVRRAAAEWRQRSDYLAEEKRVLEERLAYALAHPQPGEQTMQPQRPLVNYEADPVLQPLHQMAAEARQLALHQQQQLQQMAALQTQMAQGLAQIPVVMRMEQLKGADPGLDPKQLAEYIQRKSQSPTDIADYYKLMTYEQQLARAKEVGIAEGKRAAEIEIAKAPAVPYAPYGPAANIILPQPDFKNLDEVEAAILNDADVINTYYGQA